MTRLKLERTARGWSQEAVGLATNIFQSSVSGIERGRVRPTPDELARLAAIFGIPASELLKDVVMLESGR